MKSDNNIHRGHRKRLKKQYMDVGLDHFPEHVILELLLFFAIPYKDTNVIAHELINKFGSLSAVFDADIESLKSVKNMTENAAILLKLLPDIIRKCSLENVSKGQCYDSFEKIEEYLIKLYQGVKVETVFLLLLDLKYGLVDCVKLNEGTVNSSDASARRIVEIALARNIHQVVLAHNHPTGTSFSSNDIVATRKLHLFLSEMNIKLIENYVVVGDKAYGMVEKIENIK